MIKKYTKQIAFLCSLVFLCLPMLISAEAGGPSGYKINNPLGSDNVKLSDILLKVMRLVTQIGSIVAVLVIIYSGYKFVAAGDSDSERTEAKNNFFYTVIGIGILLGADLIANIIVGTINKTVGR